MKIFQQNTFWELTKGKFAVNLRIEMEGKVNARGVAGAVEKYN